MPRHRLSDRGYSLLMAPQPWASALTVSTGTARCVITVAIPGEDNAVGSGALYDRARYGGLEASSDEEVEDALLQFAVMTRMDDEDDPPRNLICDSLCLVGSILAENG